MQQRWNFKPLSAVVLGVFTMAINVLALIKTILGNHTEKNTSVSLSKKRFSFKEKTLPCPTLNRTEVSCLSLEAING